jgi:hypothetical protein
MAACGVFALALYSLLSLRHWADDKDDPPLSNQSVLIKSRQAVEAQLVRDSTRGVMTG